ncbi:acyltransferase family protein [Luteibacter sp. dw_328]|uniref:acyltransferase family protein n=1 Tax=Luteibacter sp. dw_328 TaxID=2719796 RepID=UPI001BD29BC5|nr:acyltransferase family protein [Luteibacter sp. dw_328]
MSLPSTEASFSTPAPAADSPKTPIHLGYRPDIDGLRAVAVLSVLCFHAFNRRLPGGFVGVDIFFVISGFLISSIIFRNMERQSFSFVDFYVRRTKRILPVLIVVLAACGAYGWFEMFPDEFRALGKHVAAGATFSSNFVLWNEAGYFDDASSTKPLLHLWSLAIEEQFYLLWPILALVSFRLRMSFLKVNVVIVLASFVAGIYLMHTDRTAAFYSPVSRFWEIGVGSALAWFVFRHPVTYATIVGKKRQADAISLLGALALAFSILHFSERLAFPGYWALLPVMGAAAVIFAGPQALVNKWVLSHRVAVWVGLISYPIYLWHWPLLTAANLSTSPFVTQHITAVKLAIMAASILLGWLSYTLIETPVKRVRADKRLAAGIFATLLLLGGAGIYTVRAAGFPERIPENLRALGAITNPYAYFQFGEAIRVDTCHIIVKMPEGFQRPAQCFSNQRPLVMLWGDSYAAALYPGLDVLARTAGFGITQVTGGNASPFFDKTKLAADNLSLYDENMLALDIATRSHPDVIIMSWMVTGSNAVLTASGTVDQKGTLAAFADTVRRIHEATPSSRIVLVGPFPHWDGTLAKVTINYLKNHPLGTQMPMYTTFGLRPEIKDWDDYFSVAIPKLGVTYVSAYKALCNASGCLTHVGPLPTDLTAVDWGHLTKAGSEYLLTRIGPAIEAELDASNRAAVPATASKQP